MASRSPYDGLDPFQRWSNLAETVRTGTFDPQGRVKFEIAAHDSIASAGSCFAMRVAERFRARGMRYLVTESPPPWMTARQVEDENYLPFSARYGLIFTTLQLFQLIERAYGRCVPIERSWQNGSRLVDPLRPRISRDGFEDEVDLEDALAIHLGAVRRLFESVDVFVFTMGLTETWYDRRDGTAYPIVPGLAGGTFDPNIHAFLNLSFAETYEYLERFLDALRAVNPRARVILTVSPIPLGATMEAQHVARSTTYSKSVLRAVAGEIADAYHNVDYFAAYEMISQSFTGEDPFVADRRHLKDGVADRVLDTFFARYYRGGEKQVGTIAAPAPSAVKICDEDIFAR